jgi:hypothetical protein
VGYPETISPIGLAEGKVCTPSPLSYVTLYFTVQQLSLTATIKTVAMSLSNKTGFTFPFRK